MQQLRSKLPLISKLILPYFAYSLLLYVIFHPESLLKNSVRVLYGGVNNTTIYSYPFWFINALLVAKLIYGSIRESKYLIYIIIALWLLIHTPLFNRYLPVPLPWGLDCACGAICYIYVGDKLKSYEFKLWHAVFIVLPFLFILLNNTFGWEYTINMKSMTYNNLVLDIVVPFIFAFALYCLALLIKRVPLLSRCLAYFSVASITVFFLHAAVLYVSKPYFEPIICVAIALAVSLLAHYTFGRFEITRKLFLGK